MSPARGIVADRPVCLHEHVPRDGSRTRERIVGRVVGVFNRKGYWGASLADLLDATGLEKGGLYHHFGSKEDLALEAFDHAVDALRRRIRASLRGAREAVPRLQRLADVWVAWTERPPFPGGCPLLNTAVEADDTHPALRARARAAMSELRDDTVARVLRRGIERGELRSDLDVEAEADLFVAAIEGGIMLTRLHRDRARMRRVAAMLHAHAESLRSEQGAGR